MSVFGNVLAASGALCWLCTPALAQQSNAAEEDVITIIGKAPPPLRKQVTEYVQQLGVVSGERPAARWIDPVCPQIIGLEPEQAARVEAQVRAVAQTVGAPLAHSGCKGNLVIAFTNDAPGLVRSLSKRQTLGDITYEQRKRLETGTDPVRWWYSHESRGANGAPTHGGVMSPALRTEGFNAGAGAAFANNGVPSTERTGSADERVASLIETATVRAIRHATVVIDSTQAKGTPLASLVDHAAMVGLAEIRLGAAPPGSILHLFASGESPRLSSNDIATLKGLYAMHLARKSDQHRRVLIGTILQDRLSNGENTTRQ